MPAAFTVPPIQNGSVGSSTYSAPAPSIVAALTVMLTAPPRPRTRV